MRRSRRWRAIRIRGVTTVFDAGNRKELILPLRAEERAGKILAPRIFATGNSITYPGSHGDRMAIAHLATSRRTRPCSTRTSPSSSPTWSS